MKNYFLVLCFLSIIWNVQSQGLVGTSSIPLTFSSIKDLGSSRNAFGVYTVSEFISASNASNSVAIIRRANSPASSGTIRADVSLDGGNTWNIDNLTPWNNNLSNNAARYPRGVIYNPSGNTLGANSMLITGAPILDGSNNNNWGGLGLSNINLNGTGLSTQSFTSTYAPDTLHEIPSSMVVAGSKVFILDRNLVSGGPYLDNLLLTTGSISGSNINWSRRILSLPTVTGPTRKATVDDMAMAFDPTGQIGYIVALTHTDFSTEPEETFLPIVFKTTNGGTTWSSPVQLSIRNQVNAALSTTTPLVISTAFEVSAVVDQSGNCHIFLQVGELGTSAYSINLDQSKGGMFHFTTNGSTISKAKKVGNPRTFRAVYGINANTINHDTRPFASRNETGTKLFFSWVETDPNYSQNNDLADFHTVGFDVATNKYTPAYRVDGAGPIVFGAVSPIVFERNGSNGTKDFELPMAFIQLNSSTDVSDSCYFRYIKGVVINSSNFNQFISTIGNATNFCTGQSVTITSAVATGNQWYRNNSIISGATSNTYTATQAGTYFTITGGDTSNILTLNFGQAPTLNLPDTIRTSNTSLTLNPGSAQTYLWSTGDTMPTLTVSTTGPYSVSGTGTFGCTTTATVYVIFLGSQPPSNTPIQSTEVVNYQGIALGNTGLPISNSNISLKLSILEQTPNGTALYSETQTVNTDGFGQFTVYLGGGTATLSSFTNIPWSNGNTKFLKVEMDASGGSNYQTIGTTQLVSVPYAMHAKTVDELKIGTILRGNNGSSYQLSIGSNGPEWTPVSASCGQAVSHLGESYPTVQIGTQCWMSKNMNVGTMISSSSNQTNNATLEKYCYNNDATNCTTYGGLYLWAEAVQYQNGATNTSSPSPAFVGNVNGICPTGWHLPSDGEWTTLENALGGASLAGGKMKSTSNLWTVNIGATNSSGFSGLPAGVLLTNGAFNDLGIYSNFWSLSESGSNASRRGLGYNYSFIGSGSFSKTYGFSIRCLKD